MSLIITIVTKEGFVFSSIDNGPGIEAGDLNAALCEVKNEEAIRALRLQFSSAPPKFGELKIKSQIENENIHRR